MTEPQKRLEELLDKYSSNEITEPEFNELCDIIKASGNDVILKNILESGLRQTEFSAMNKAQLDVMLRRILQTASDERKIPDHVRNDGRVLRIWKRWAVAASIILAVGIGSYLLFFNKSTKSNDIAKTNTVPHDVAAPNVARATLKLDDGRIVYLDSASNGSLAVQGNVNVVKLADGKLVYSQESGVRSQEIKYNTISNPRGSKVQSLTLIDGTQVWLNAESSITYPTAFVGGERKVSIIGEAYFEVTKDAGKKFIVDANGVTTEVLGTHFNVNSYQDEADTKITLLEGSVKVSKGNSIGLLKPGQQAILRQTQDDNQVKVINDADLEQVMAWKDGVFKFKNTNIGEIMRQVARWYDVEIEYKGNYADLNFGGSVSRQANVSELLKRLEATEAVKFNVEERKIVVMVK